MSQITFKEFKHIARVASGTFGYVYVRSTIQGDVPFNPEGAIIVKDNKELVFRCIPSGQEYSFTYIDNVFNLMTARRGSYKVLVLVGENFYTLTGELIFSNGNIVLQAELFA